MRLLTGFFILNILCGFSPATSLSQSTDEIRFTILHTNDEHSHLIPHPAANYHPGEEFSAIGGFARLAGLINQIREEKSGDGEPVLLFSGGDIIGGSVFAWLSLHGLAPELNLMQLIGYDGVVIGNHEFDYGPEQLNRYLRVAGYPDANEYTNLLGTNIHPPDDHPLSTAGINHSVLMELENGLTVGIFGLIGEDAIDKTAFPGPVEFSDPFETANQTVRELLDNGADIIISVNHSGEYEDRILAQKVPEIDVIVGGHYHTPLYEPIREGKTVIVQAGSYTEYLGVLELAWDPETRQVEPVNNRSGAPYLIPIDDTITPDPDIREMISFYENTLNQWVGELTGGMITDIRQTVARSDFSLNSGPPLQETNLGNFITDAMRIVSENATGKRVDVAVQANGAIRSNIHPGEMDWSEGEITFYDMIMSSGLGSGDDGNPGFPIVAFYLTEDEVRRVMEISHLLSELRGNTYFLQFSGIRKNYDPDRAILMSIPFSGTPIPTKRAILNAELYTCEGRQTDDENWRPLEKGSDQLLHVVTDYYIASFLPLVGDLLPDLMISFKDEQGEPLGLDDAIITRNGSQLKVWQALVEYTTGLPQDESGIPVIPEYYNHTGDRLVIVNTVPLLFWPVAGILILTGITTFLYIRRKRSVAPSD
jgi:5'-nucleotidase / UDP-sugar diphosphatase